MFGLCDLAVQLKEYALVSQARRQLREQLRAHPTCPISAFGEGGQFLIYFHMLKSSLV